MLRLDQRGMATVMVVVIIAASAGGAVATPVVVDVADVDPDHPLYALERLGERVRMVGDEDLMRERCFEGYRMWEKYGEAALRYDVFKEFVRKAEMLLKEPTPIADRVWSWLEEETARAGVVVDLYDVDPDHVLYEFEKEGEVILEIAPEELMVERWSEYERLVDRGKGLEYKVILEEFVEKMRECVPGDVEVEVEVIRWMQEQMPGIGRVQLMLCKEMLVEIKEEMPELEVEIEVEIEAIENYLEELPALPPAEWEKIRAHIRLIREKFENLHPDWATVADINDLIADASITVNVEVEITIDPPPIAAAEFEEELDEFSELLAEVQAMLEGAPENAAGRRAVERLVEAAIELKDKAMHAYEAGAIRRALALIHAAQVHLRNAKTILEHASEWEEEFKEEWAEWKEEWEEMKQEWKERWEELREELEKIPAISEENIVVPEIPKVSIGDILANPDLYFGRKVIVEGEISVVGGIYHISDGTGVLAIEGDFSAYVGAKVRIEGSIELGPMIVGGVQIEVELLTVIEATPT